MKLSYIHRRRIALLSLLAGITLVITGMLLTGQINWPSWLQGLVILLGFIISSFGTKLLRCPKCHQLPDKETMLNSRTCSKCQYKYP